ncbi:MAG TPA: serine/threonine-protein kinase [Steroidobacteraceae bacterium]|jgi:tRNA A-37 threonylcarbamoyl transferase component Bud32|nr:serine/threonine-protein kinase [Steroidobacteraceae bacterium]
MANQTQPTLNDAPGPAERSRSTVLCLVVHDELELRLRLAALIRRAIPKVDADTVTRAGFDAISVERLRAYVAVMFIVEFTPPEAAAAALASLELLHKRAPNLPIFVFARGGNERTAVRAMKLGASDYWPIHSVMVGELCSTLQPLIEPPPPAATATIPIVDRWRQPEIAGYALLKKIAQSAAASVYLARNAEFPSPVALKIHAIRGQQVVSVADRERFAKECEILSKLNHRSIANVLDYGVTDDYLYLALEYFPCGSLRERLKHPVSEADAVNYAHQIGEALQIVHAAHIVHRDLKPSNLMLTNENRLVLIDFGSARTQFTASDLTRSQDCTGTPYYVCPEQIDDREPDARGDLYSLGVVLFEMLSGALPFLGKTLADILAAHRTAPVPRLPEHLKTYQAIVDRLLAKAPQDRYACAAEFLDALDGVRAESGNRKSSNP